jgi:hypothetical protein
MKYNVNDDFFFFLFSLHFFVKGKKNYNINGQEEEHVGGILFIPLKNCLYFIILLYSFLSWGVIR